MYIEKYFENLKKVLVTVEQTQKATIEKVAKVVAERLVDGGAWHIQDSGHMLMYELIDRAGGLACIQPLQINVNIDDRVRAREGDTAMKPNAIPELVPLVLKASKIRKGDVLVIGSTSGYSYFPVEFALQAKAMGVVTIAMTAKAYSDALVSQHPSGKKLYEVCDYYFDNCSNIGDAIVHMDEIDKDIAPASGISAAYIMWALQVGVAEEMIKMGKDPAIYKSIHAPKGREIYYESKDIYAKRGY